MKKKIVWGGGFIAGLIVWMCATPALAQKIVERGNNTLVTGILADERGNVLRTDAEPFINLTLLKRAGQTNDFVMMTDCADGQGCVNDASGRFWFMSAFDGQAFAPGKYLLVVFLPSLNYGEAGVWTSNEYESRVIELTLGAGVNDIGVVTVRSAKIRLLVQQSRMSNPNGGLRVNVDVFSLSLQPIRFLLDGEMNAPGRNGITATQHKDFGSITLARRESKTFTFEVPNVLAGVVDGTYVGGYFQAKDPNDPWSVLAEVGFYVPKY